MDRTQFGYCNLSCKPTRAAVVTKDGYLYDREMILQHIVQEKELIRKRKMEYIAHKILDKKKEVLKVHEEALRKKRGFEKVEDGKSALSDGPGAGGKESGEKQPLTGSSNFWLAEATPDAGAKVKKVLHTTPLCPRSRRPLKFKKLKKVNFVFNDSVKFGKPGYILCSATRKPITIEKCVFIRTTGDIVLKSFFENVSKATKESLVWNGKRIKSADIIFLK